MDDMAAVIQPRPTETMAASAPLAIGEGSRAIAFDSDRVITLATFLDHVRGVAALLPSGRHAVNLCEDRYRFLVAFCAVAVRGQVTLLPSSRAPSAIDTVLACHDDSYCLGDSALTPAPAGYWRLPEPLPCLGGDMPMLADDALAAIGFTSGSTGQPNASPKTWGSLRISTANNLSALQTLWPESAQPGIVATVPPQHMYGLELSVLLPLLANASVHAGHPFFPEDVAYALRAADAPRVLVTTPVHLRALLNADIDLPPLAAIVSATAPLDMALAAAAETRFETCVQEFFGSTETCILATRRTALESVWTALPRVRLQPQPDGALVHADHLSGPVVLADLVEIVDDDHRDENRCRFKLCGRNADLIEIAGKRASLGDIGRKLLAIPGVHDGVVFQLDADPAHADVRRLAALVVAPGLEPAAILAVLRHSIDPVFLPRPLRCVSVLPRNSTGKLPRQALLDHLSTAAGHESVGDAAGR